MEEASVQAERCGQRADAQINEEVAQIYRRARLLSRFDLNWIAPEQYMAHIMPIVYRRLQAYIHNALAVTDRYDLDDHTQETLLRFYRVRPEPDLTRTPVLGYLFTIAANIQTDIIRKNYVRREKRAELSARLKRTSVANNSALAFELNQALECIADADIRRSAYLLFVEEWKQQEVADHLNLPLATINYYAKKAREHFRYQLNPQHIAQVRNK